MKPSETESLLIKVNEDREMIGYSKISKKEFYALGGFSNPRLVRVSRGKSWAYYSK